MMPLAGRHPARSPHVIRRPYDLCVSRFRFRFPVCRGKSSVPYTDLSVHRQRFGSVFAVLLHTGIGAFGQRLPEQRDISWAHRSTVSLGKSNSIAGVSPFVAIATQ
jgi:hypothetical protein